MNINTIITDAIVLFPLHKTVNKTFDSQDVDFETVNENSDNHTEESIKKENLAFMLGWNNDEESWDNRTTN